MPTVLEVLDDSKKELGKKDTEVTQRLLTAYTALQNNLESSITQLKSELILLDSKGDMSVSKVRSLAVYGKLLDQLNDEMVKYGVVVDYEINLLSKTAIEQASKYAKQMVTPLLLDSNIWATLPSESIETLLGFLSSESPLHDNLLNKLGPIAVETFEQTLLSNIALGYNPITTGRLLSNTLNQPLHWTLQTVRTAQLWSYREASRANYAFNGDIVEGWIWYANLTTETCVACINNHGKVFTLDKPLNDHHNGRCLSIPKVFDKFAVVDQSVVSGETWFNSLPVDQQKQIMGQERLNLYKQGKFEFNDLTTTYSNNIYGDMVTEVSLKQLRG